MTETLFDVGTLQGPSLKYYKKKECLLESFKFFRTVITANFRSYPVDTGRKLNVHQTFSIKQYQTYSIYETYKRTF